MTKPTTAPPATTALVALGETGVTYNLDAFPEDRYNRLVPTQTIAMPSDLMVPVIQVVKLDPTPDNGDVYHSGDMKPGHNAPTARALSKFATAAGVSFLDERRVDDGKDPNVCGVTVIAEMTLPTGQRQRATGSKWVDMGRMVWSSPAHRGKFAGFLYEHTATRARNRALRALLSLRGSYPAAELARPFAVVSFAPNMNHPEVRVRILEAMAPSVAQLYGPAAAPQLAAGQVVEAVEAPEDDDDPIVVEAQEVNEPSWFDAPPAASAGPTAAEQLAAVLRQAAAQSGIVGGITEAQKASLQGIFRPLGLESTAAGLRIVFGLAALGDITGAQAQALINASIAGNFGDLWRELVAAEGAQAA